MAKILTENNQLHSEVFDTNAGKLIWFCLLRDMDDDGLIHTSALSLSKELDICESTVRRILSAFESEGVLTNKMTNKCRKKGRMYVLCNTSIYVSRGRIKRRINDEYSDDKKTATSITEPRAGKAERFTPPTDEEVSRYAAEKGYHFNPESFIPHYQSKGWKVGSEPMKDWRAAMCTWEIRWKQKYGEKYYYQLAANGDAAKSPSRYAGLRAATAAVLQQPGNIDAMYDDYVRHS